MPVPSSNSTVDFSIAISSYCRRDLIGPTIESALAFIDAMPGTRGEVVIADDASTDDTVAFIRSRFSRAIADETVRLIVLDTNVGPAGAKNRAVIASRGKWVLLLDSDDELLVESASEVAGLMRSRNTPLWLFRCVDFDTGELVGPEVEHGYDLDLVRYLNEGTPGECLPIVLRDAFERYPFNERWRGREGWAWSRMIETYGPARLEPLRVRRYRQSHTNRVSTPASSRRDAVFLAEYHGAMLARYRRQMGAAAALRRILKIIYYRGVAGWRRTSDS